MRSPTEINVKLNCKTVINFTSIGILLLLAKDLPKSGSSFQNEVAKWEPLTSSSSLNDSHFF